jgi:hypothetical protein
MLQITVALPRMPEGAIEEITGPMLEIPLRVRRGIRKHGSFDCVRLRLTSPRMTMLEGRGGPAEQRVAQIFELLLAFSQRRRRTSEKTPP